MRLVFNHEEKHKSFPVPGVDKGTFEIPEFKNHRLGNQLATVLKAEIGSSFGVARKFQDFQSSEKDQNIECHGSCDLSSVMMYSYLRKAVTTAKKNLKLAKLPEGCVDNVESRKNETSEHSRYCGAQALLW